MRLYLIGLPGVGKSSVGELLAKKLGYKYIDMDNYIEQKACMFVDEIFSLYGEKYFRDLETNVLKEFNDLDNIVISTGGGVIKDIKNKSLMNGICIYLTAPLNVIEKRLANSNIVRPLLLEKTINDLYFERKEQYEYFQDMKFENMNIKETVKEIIMKLGVTNESINN